MVAPHREPSVTDSDTTSNDITVLRGNSGSGGGEAIATPRVLKQRFVLEAKLGSGGMGTVYKAKDLRKVEARDRNPYVAVKVLNNDFRAHPDAFIALQREASKSQALAHPNIVSIFDFDKDGDIPFMTMELLEGQELTRLLHDYPNGLPDELAWSVVDGLCAGLGRAHAAGITHSDFKPGNVFVAGDGTPKVLDFGIARAVQANVLDGEDTAFDPAKLAALTPAYASREMLEGEVPTPSDDIFSLGVVIYLVFTGQHPYQRVRADEACRKAMAPERIKRLNRRQWRTVERMLAFERESRPADIAEISDGLAHKPVLRTVLVVGTMVALAALAGFFWLGPSEEVKVIVAQDALRDAQIERVTGLLAAPSFDEAWERQVFEEFSRLAELEGAQADAEAVRARVLEMYLDEITAAPDFEQALALQRRADRYALTERFEAGHQALEDRALSAFDERLDARLVDRDWIHGVELELTRFAAAFPDSTRYAELEMAAADVYGSAIERLIDRGDVELAAELLDLVTPKEFDYDILQSFSVRLTELRRRVDVARSFEAEAAAAEQVTARLSDLTDVSCGRLDVAALKGGFDDLVAHYPSQASIARETLTGAVADCVVELGETDQDRAVSLKDDAIAAFGPIARLEGITLDPCGMRYLVGAGSQPGRSGFCADVLGDGASGPKLVVVPLGEGRFAISKFEISWGEAAAFCAAIGGCEAAEDPGLPVRSFGVEQAQALADWFSSDTGHHYRLPQLEEWQAAAVGEPDPNRNCKVQVAGVERLGPVPAATGRGNDFGLVNALGNVREWVIDGDQLVVVGGGFNDPIASCTQTSVTPHDGSADKATGLRLVRVLP